MSKPKTHVAIILDKSGSMQTIKEQTIQGFNEQVQQLKENAKEQEIFVSLITFNGNVTENIWDKPVEEITEAAMDDYVPNGATAMRDAVGYTIQKFQEEQTDEEDVAYLVIVISDGFTNSDHQFSSKALKEMMDSCQNSGKWTFTFMGCSKDYMLQIAKQTGVSIRNMAAFDHHSANMAYDSMVNYTSGYLDQRKRGITKVDNFVSDDEVVKDFTS